MSATTLAPPDTSQRLVLHSIGWDQYRQISDALTGRHLRLTFYRGTLEFMTISPLHGHLCRLLARMVVALTEELDLPRKSFGDMTCDRETMDSGLEPDECFYIAHEPDVRDKDELDFDVDPPPDLAIEVDLTRAPRNRMRVYAALGVPEVWRFDGQTLTAHVLRPDATYVPAEQSLSFPPLRPADLTAFLARRGETDENTLVRNFRAWARQTLAEHD